MDEESYTLNIQTKKAPKKLRSLFVKKRFEVRYKVKTVIVVASAAAYILIVIGGGIRAKIRKP